MNMKTRAILETLKFRRICKRFKKLKRILHMLWTIKIILIMGTVCLCLLTIIIYQVRYITFSQHHPKTHQMSQSKRISSTSRNYDTPMRHIPYKEVYNNINTHDEDLSIEIEESKQANMIDTPGCVIPVAMVDYKKKIRKSEGCGKRIIYMKRYDEENVQAIISNIRMAKLLKMNEKYDCCYRFFERSNVGRKHLKLEYTPCQNLRNGEKIKLKSDFINVKCFQYGTTNKSHIIYEDNYVLCKRISLSNAKSNSYEEKYNVLVIGMGSMSLPRLAKTMSRTIHFFQNQNWLSYRGYHKVGDNKLPNLLPILTGKNFTEIIERCGRKMDDCNDYFLWSLFKNSGYVTAYGEDYLHLPDAFGGEFNFQKPPTDHYMRPFFLNREYEIDNGSLLCSGKITTGEQILDFAYDFALTYRNDSFFGFFWVNSFSHRVNNHPQDADLLFENFFNRLIYTGVLDNTFIIFMSDHGLRFGKQRQLIESYYDNRMPFLFFSIANAFRINYPDKLKQLLINQFRLVTPYDLFETLNELRNLTNDVLVLDQYNKTENHGRANERQSLLRHISGNRTCKGVGIHEKWCSCHKLYPLDVKDPEGIRSVQHVAIHIKNALKKIKTRHCWRCLNLSIQNISRIHFYYDTDKVNLYYVVAFSMSPKNVLYEAVVLRNETRMDLVGSVDLISQYEGYGECTMKRADKYFCICQKIDNCRISLNL